MHKAERGLFELRRGRLLCVTPTGTVPSDGAVVLASVEGLDVANLAELRRLGDDLRLLVTLPRAQSMGLVPSPNGEGANGSSPTRTNGRRMKGLSVRLSSVVGPDEILRLSSARIPVPPADLTDAREASPTEAAGLALARLGRMLPALVSVSVAPGRLPLVREVIENGDLLTVGADEVEAMVGAPAVEVTYVSDAPVPLEESENARFMLFSETNGLLEHVAILIGDPATWPDPVPVRFHSACLTGDLFGSLRCDCGAQLRGALSYFAENGGGILLYLAQEGRGIGLGNKLRAYKLQQGGLDTVDADCALGFGPDERRYDAAVEILRKLGVRRIRLLTNNPDKVRAAEEGGIEVVERQPLRGTLNRHNLPYVRAKVHRAGHWLVDMLAETVPDD